MSITVKNISFSVNGTPSKQFNIELDGAKYTLEKFKMTQKLLEPCKLEFKLRKSPEEDINEIQFTTCGSIIGKEVKLTLQTDSMEQEIQGFSEGTQNADIEFEGFVTSAKATRKESEYAIEVMAETAETVMKNSPDYRYYNEKNLDDIVNSQLEFCSIDAKAHCKKQDQLFFTAQYMENSYQFLQRLACRFGEWMFNNGKEFHFGKLDKQDQITLAYPSRDLPQYSARLKTYDLKHIFHHNTYSEYNAIGENYIEEAPKIGNKLSDLVSQASYEKYNSSTADESNEHSIERDDSQLYGSNDGIELGKDYFPDPHTAYLHGRLSNLLIYEGKSYCSKMKIGAKLTIKDNFINSDSSQEKSEVQQDEILITEVVHKFNVDQQYSNNFKGITAAIDYPPYLDPTIYPVCNHPIRAIVKDNEDPKHLGRVRVRMHIPNARITSGDSNDPKGWTPWIHVVLPYTGAVGTADDNTLYGMHLIPEIQSQVLVDFEGGNFERPYVCGAVDAASYAPDDPKWYIGNNNVKAIRTASGHTIEIHDVQNDKEFGDGGFIKIYDNHTHDYEVLLSTDRNLIKLKSVGNIELEAGKDIILNAQNDIKLTAQKNVEEWAMEEMTLHSEKAFKGDTRNTMTFFAHKNMSMNTDEEMSLSSEKDMHITCHKDRTDKVDGKYHGETKKDYEIKSNQHARFIVTVMYSVKSKNIHLEAQKDYEGWGMTVTLDGQKDIYLNAMATINISAPMIKES